MKGHFSSCECFEGIFGGFVNLLLSLPFPQSRRIKSLLLGASVLLAPAVQAFAGTCTVDATQTNQYIHCIGASSAWSGIGSLGQALFADDNVNGHIGITSLRARIDPNNSFSSEVNTLVAAKAVNPNILFWATEWSPPAQYKANNNVDGGASNDTFLGASSGSPNSDDTGLANYQVSFIQYCQSHGINLYALSIQNEPNFNPTYEACLWSAGQFAVYTQAFHSALQSAGLSTKIMLPEPDNTSGMNLATTAMDDATIAPMIGIIGTHLYGSPNPAPLSSYGYTHVTNQEWWETEMSGNTTDIPGALQEAGWIQNSLVNSNMNAFHYWWLTDLISGSNLTIKAFVLGNYSKFIRPGFYRMGATAAPTSGISVSAFKNTNNSSPQTIVFVAINNNSGTTSQTFSINGVNVTSVTPWVTDGSNNLVAKSPVAVSGGSFTYSLTGSSVTSFVGVVSGVSGPTNTPTKTNTPAPSTATFTPTKTNTPVVSSTWRVNAGGPSYTDSTGNVWAADENYSGGSTVASGGTITGTSDSTLYDTQRYGTSFTYSFSVPAGSYQVTLKLAETYSGDYAAGDRVFNVAINGSTVSSNLDIYSQVGSNAADDKVFNNISPSGGVITITFTGGSSTDVNAVIEALQVVPMPVVTATPTRTFTSTTTSTSTYTSTSTFTATHTPTSTFSPTPVVSSTWRVNAGGPSYTDTLGNVWAADENFSGGSTIGQGGTVTGTNDSTLYDTQRYGSSFSYSFNVPAGSYQVTLKLAEVYSGDFSAGARILNAAINGSSVVSNLDLFAQVGSNAADDQVINNVSPVGGVITIQFTAGSGTDANAVIEALQVIPMPPPPTLTFTATKTSTSTSTATSTSTSTSTKTNTPVPPTATDSMTATPSLTVMPSSSSTLTPVFTATRTNTPVPPTNTFTSVPPTATRTNTPVPPTNTPVPPTNTFTAVPPTATRTNTPVPPTATDTAVPPTNTFTAVPPTATRTNTPVPPTNTFTPTPTFTSTPTQVLAGGSFKVQLLSAVTSGTTNSPHPQLQIVNTGSGSLNLNNVTVRYWFNCDCTNQALQAWVDWAGLIPAGTNETSNVKVTVDSTSLGGQTDYVLYTFTGNMVLQPGQALQIQSRFNKSDWSNMSQSNDWSFAPTTSFTDAPDVTGYLSGSLVWGQQPAGTVAVNLTVSSAVAFPNPSIGNGTTLAFTLGGRSSGVQALDDNHSLVVDPNAKITLGIYTLGGRLIWSQTLTGGAYGSTGQHDVYWDEHDLGGARLANGLYLLRVTVESNGQSSSTIGKILILG